MARMKKKEGKPRVDTIDREHPTVYVIGGPNGAVKCEGHPLKGTSNLPLTLALFFLRGWPCDLTEMNGA